MARSSPHFYSELPEDGHGFRNVEAVRTCLRCGVQNVIRMSGTNGQRWRVHGGQWTSKKIACSGLDTIADPDAVARARDDIANARRSAGTGESLPGSVDLSRWMSEIEDCGYPLSCVMCDRDWSSDVDDWRPSCAADMSKPPLIAWVTDPKKLGWSTLRPDGNVECVVWCGLVCQGCRPKLADAIDGQHDHYNNDRDLESIDLSVFVGEQPALWAVAALLGRFNWEYASRKQLVHIAMRASLLDGHPTNGDAF